MSIFPDQKYALHKCLAQPPLPENITPHWWSNIVYRGWLIKFSHFWWFYIEYNLQLKWKLGFLKISVHIKQTTWESSDVWRWELWMPPVKKAHTMHRVHDNLHSMVKSRFLAIPHWRVMEYHFYSVMPHISAYIYCELQTRQNKKKHSFCSMLSPIKLAFIYNQAFYNII